MGLMDVVHGVLDVAGFIPVVGAVADLANAAIYAAEGDWGNAALSAVSAVPGFGDAVGAVKILAKSANALGKALPKAKNTLSFCGKLTGKAKTGAKRIANKGRRKKKAKKAKKEAKKNAAKNKCFTGDTLVCTNYGLCPINEIQKGDDIYSRNEKTGETGLRKVEEVIRTEAHTIYSIWLDGKEQIKTTAYHPVFEKDKGWVSVINLREGNLLETMEGSVQVTKIEKMRYEEPVEVYNFSVEEWETYFVSEKHVYVHNCSERNTNGNEGPSLDDRIRQAELAQKKAGDLSDKYGYSKRPKKTVASDGTTNTLSGWKNLDENSEFTRVPVEDVFHKSNEIGHKLRSAGANDQGLPGRYNASHAEKQLSVLSDKPIGISQPMCKDCQDYFKKLSVSEGKEYVTADPKTIRIFKPDGSVQEIIR